MTLLLAWANVCEGTEWVKLASELWTEDGELQKDNK